MTAFDRRLTPARADLAAQHLEGVVEAAHFVSGIVRRVVETAAPLRRNPDFSTGLETEAIFGEAVTIYEEVEGWAWGQLDRDGYVGFLPAQALGPPATATHRVSALRTFIYPTPSIKTPPMTALTFGSEIRASEETGLFTAAEGGFIFSGHLAPLGSIEGDPVTVAEQFVGVPYLWGGRTSLGLDCSALVQTALQACGIACPRDSDMQEEALGSAIDPGPDFSQVRRGDLLFWKGHVALARSPTEIIHGNGRSMTVAIEDLAACIARIAAAGDPLRTVKRLG